MRIKFHFPLSTNEQNLKNQPQGAQAHDWVKYLIKRSSRLQ